MTRFVIAVCTVTKGVVPSIIIGDVLQIVHFIHAKFAVVMNEHSAADNFEMLLLFPIEQSLQIVIFVDFEAIQPLISFLWVLSFFVAYQL